VIILAIFIALLMLCMDLVYATVDPRIKAQYINQSKRRAKAHGN
jgi:peptide/nickel transport system permease protein